MMASGRSRAPLRFGCARICVRMLVTGLSAVGRRPLRAAVREKEIAIVIDRMRYKREHKLTEA